MLHQLIRYRPILELLAAGGYESVCEVGSGSSGIAAFSSLRLVGVDMDFKDYTTERRACPANLIPVVADGAVLPFTDNRFDVVISCDMLEHVPPADRRAVVEEMLRIAAKKVVLVFPCGHAASMLDGLLRRACLLAGRQAPGWLDEHVTLGLPARDTVSTMLDGIGLKYTARRNGFIPLHYATLVLESIGRIRAALSRASLKYCGKEKENGGSTLADALTWAAMKISDLPPAYRCAFVIDKHGSKQG